jgi:hypothetical protein
MQTRAAADAVAMQEVAEANASSLGFAVLSNDLIYAQHLCDLLSSDDKRRLRSVCVRVRDTVDAAIDVLVIDASHLGEALTRWPGVSSLSTRCQGYEEDAQLRDVLLGPTHPLHSLRTLALDVVSMQRLARPHACCLETEGANARAPSCTHYQLHTVSAAHNTSCTHYHVTYKYMLAYTRAPSYSCRRGRTSTPGACLFSAPQQQRDCVS